ncbi:MAG: CvpA family protein [Bacteroidales bacterium]|nr:CvpA family protein [Bacteroidales bacterium]
MNQTTTIPIEVPIGSGVDLLIGILIIIGAVVGFKRGVIVECISFFAVLVLLTICVNISKSVFKYLTPRSDVPDLFAIILMTVIFVAGLVFAVSRINFLTMKILSSTTVIGTAYRALGAFFGGLKFYFISAVFLVTLFKIDEHAKFLPDSAKYSRLSRGSIWFVTSIFPYLQLDKKEPRPFDYPNGSSEIENCIKDKVYVLF